MRIFSASGSMPAGAVAAQHVRQRDLGVGLGDARRVEVDRGAAVGRLDALALRDLVDDRLRDDVARAERVGELLAVGVQEHGAVRARRLGDRVALHVRGPGAAVRVVLERVEVARLGAEAERDLGHLAGRAGMVRRELAALLRRRGSSGRRRRGRRSPASIACSPQRRAPAVLGRLELARAATCSNDVPEPAAHASRSAFVIAWPVRSPTWSRRFARRAAAAGEAVAAVLARELDAELLEPVDRATAPRRSAPRRAACRPSRGSSARRPRRAARASRPRRTRPGCRPAPWPSCTTGASPSPRRRRARPRARRTRRRRGRRPRCRSRARRIRRPRSRLAA